VLEGILAVVIARLTGKVSYEQSGTKERRYLINKRIIYNKTRGGDFVAQRYCKVKTPLAEPKYSGLNSGVKGRGQVGEEVDGTLEQRIYK
jgi:hypothetical protein